MKFVKLPEGSEKKSYYKFINEPLNQINKDEEYTYTHMARDAKKALKFKDRSKLLKRNFIPEEEGYYILDDGTIVISTSVEVSNITGENFDWWMIWHQLDPLRHAIWNPEDHYNIKISDGTRKKLLESNVPLHERIWNTHCYVEESMNGGKPINIDINFIKPKEYGYDTSKYGTDSCMAMVASIGNQQIGPLSIPVFMTEVIRKTPDGKTKWISHWWLGHGFEHKKEVYEEIPLHLRKLVAQKASMLIVHNHKEVQHLDKFIKQIYEENKDNWLE